MGCASSKGGSSSSSKDVAVYHPPPTSVSLFDITAVEEPWLIAKQRAEDDEEDDEEEEETTTDDDDDDDDEKQPPAAVAKTVVPLQLLDKLEGYELAPASWSEVSKALEDIKPVLHAKPPPAVTLKKKTKKKKTKKQQQQPEQPAAAAQPPVVVPAATDGGAAAAAANKAAPAAMYSIGSDLPDKPAAPPELAGRRVVTDNPFLMRDRESSNKPGAGDPPPRWRRRDPFEGFPERRPPGPTGGGVVLYTTTLRGVRRTFEDCERARDAVEACAVAAGVPGAVDERDVALHAEYLRELRELMADESDGGGGGGVAMAPPRLFVMGRYVGGAEETVRLAEAGTLREMMRWAKARGEACAAAKDGRGCEGCGGARFVPCWECGGSCKVPVVAATATATATTAMERCGKCNENGLMMCPICH